MAAITSAVVIGAATMANAQAEQNAIGDTNALAARGIFQGGSFNGAGGSAGISFGDDGAANITTGLGAFEGSFQSLIDQAGSFFGGNAGGANDFLGMLQGLGQGSIAGISASEGLIDRTLANSDDFNILGEQFQNDISLVQQDTGELGQQIASQFRPALERAQGTLRNTTFDKLFSSGKFANSQAASPVVEGLSQQFGEQNVALQNFGVLQAQQRQQDAFGRALGASQQREAIGSRNFGETFNMSQLFGQNAQSQFGIGSNMFSQFLNNQSQQQGLGLQALGGAQGISQMPLAFLSAIMGAGALRSDSTLGAAQISAGMTPQATSAFGEGTLGGLSAFGAANPGAFTSSDARLKDNITRIGTLGDLGWYEWDWNDKAKALGCEKFPCFGVIAQEVSKIMPKAVLKTPSGYLTVNYSMVMGA